MVPGSAAVSAVLVVPVLGAQGPSGYSGEIAVALADVADVFVVPEALVRAVIRVESNFDPKARSPAGAIGLMQVMPATARKVGLSPSDLWDPALNILAGVRLLAALLRHYEGDLIGALSAHNAGPRRLGAPLPRNGETPAYVAAVLRHFKRYGRSWAPASPRPPFALTEEKR